MSNIRFLSLVVVLAVISMFASACAPSSSAEPVGESISEPELDAVQITLPNDVFTADDVAAVGWKKSKELSPETLPDVASVWYGFYDQRDVEVRVYETQAEAISSGQEIADVATGRRKPAPFASGGISSTRTSYSTYAIVGNLILLCEIKIEDCQSLIDGIGR
ncbi:MAG: hypothetical protein HN926_01115 [Chloroflexi bacterium]|jgi:hypothetical protein|nr:hypothetical protein [Chloroflexota bacterium]MBT3862187.1 hypothetical protein [Chloroflexota bacterium]MBT4142904.1 hypothetical protein [Chloroflexota bacterium]MBT4340789.1 hypothetical protein [Chloroflexota bacterium]MBT5254129.1 hypothetical protein [Chloroflexota bacterium]